MNDKKIIALYIKMLFKNIFTHFFDNQSMRRFGGQAYKHFIFLTTANLFQVKLEKPQKGATLD